MMVVHVDKVKQCLWETPTSWLGSESYNVIPNTLEPDVLSNMFGGVDRGGVSTSNDDVELSVVVRPKRNAGMPARFLSRVYAVYDDASSNLYNLTNNEHVDDFELYLLRFSDMKRTVKRSDMKRTVKSTSISAIPVANRTTRPDHTRDLMT